VSGVSTQSLPYQILANSRRIEPISPFDDLHCQFLNSSYQRAPPLYPVKYGQPNSASLSHSNEFCVITSPQPPATESVPQHRPSSDLYRRIVLTHKNQPLWKEALAIRSAKDSHQSKLDSKTSLTGQHQIQKWYIDCRYRSETLVRQPNILCQDTPLDIRLPDPQILAVSSCSLRKQRLPLPLHIIRDTAEFQTIRLSHFSDHSHRFHHSPTDHKILSRPPEFHLIYSETT